MKLNDQLVIEGFETDDFERLLQSVGRSIEIYEQGAAHLAFCPEGSEKRMLMLANHSLREGILESFDDLLDMLSNRDQAFKAISEVMKATAETNIEKGFSGVRAFYVALQSYLEAPTEENKEVFFAALPEDIRDEIEEKMKTASDSGLAFYNDSPVIKKMMRPIAASKEREDISLSKKADATFTLLEGWLDPYEVAIIEEISKFKMLENQSTASGKTFCTVGQLYRALRGGGEQSPTKAQRENIMQDLQQMSENNRKFTFKINDYVKIWGGFETNGGRVRILSYDEFFGKIRGQEETLIVFDDTAILNLVSERLKMYEVIPQELKAIQEKYYTLTLESGEVIQGNSRKIKQEIKKRGLSDSDILEEEFVYKKMSLSRSRIAIRTQLLKFVFGYLRARTANANCSNQLRYETIFQNCNINESSRETVRRAKEDIKTMLEYFQLKSVISSWQEYTNRGSKKPDGIQISISQALIEGEGG